jgi:tetratricopeptide (TPR) repeat protein
MAALRRKRAVRIMKSPISLHHLGYLKTSKKVQTKFSNYVKYNEKQLEVTEGKDPRPYCSLALHWMQEDRKDLAIANFQYALKLDPFYWHANTQMAALNLNAAKTYLNNALVSLPEGHEVKEQVKNALAFLDKYKFGHYKIDFSKRGETECPLPVKT